MPKYRKKPVVIEANQYTEYGKLVRGMCNSQSCYNAGNNKPHVHTIHFGQLVNLEVGDFVIPEADGVHFYPCKADVFAATYEPARERDEARADFRDLSEAVKAAWHQCNSAGLNREQYATLHRAFEIAVARQVG